MDRICYHMDDVIEPNDHCGLTGTRPDGQRYAAYRSKCGLDFRKLNLDFLPYWLTAEMVEIQYIDYKGLHKRVKSWIDIDYNHTPRFRMIPYKHPEKTGKEIHSAMQSIIIGLGQRHPSIPPMWPMKEVVRFHILRIDQLVRTYGGVGYYGKFTEALYDFTEIMFGHKITK